MGMPSLYRGLLDPRRLPALKGLLRAEAWATQQPHENDWVRFLALVNETENPLARLVVKSPNHSFRWPALRRHFPHAPLVWIARDPAATFESNLKMWRAMVELYGLAPVPPDILEAFIDAAFAEAARVLPALCAECPRSQLAVVDFDELVAQPVATASRALTRLLPETVDTATAAMAAVAQHRANVRSARYEGADVPPARQTLFAKLADAQRAALTSHGV
jgi:hypothetical protein